MVTGLAARPAPWRPGLGLRAFVEVLPDKTTPGALAEAMRRAPEVPNATWWPAAPATRSRRG